MSLILTFVQTITLQNMHHGHYTLQFSIVVLQDSIPLLSSQRFKENIIKSSIIIRYGSHLKAKSHRISLEMYRVWKLHTMSLVMWTYQNDLSLNLCIMPFMSYMVIISENSLVRSYKKKSRAHCY